MKRGSLEGGPGLKGEGICIPSDEPVNLGTGVREALETQEEDVGKLGNPCAQGSPLSRGTGIAGVVLNCLGGIEGIQTIHEGWRSGTLCGTGNGNFQHAPGFVAFCDCPTSLTPYLELMLAVEVLDDGGILFLKEGAPGGEGLHLRLFLDGVCGTTVGDADPTIKGIMETIQDVLETFGGVGLLSGLIPIVVAGDHGAKKGGDEGRGNIAAIGGLLGDVVEERLEGVKKGGFFGTFA